MEPQNIFQIVKENVKKLVDNFPLVIFISATLIIPNIKSGYLFKVQWIHQFVSSDNKTYSLMLMTMFVIDTIGILCFLFALLSLITNSMGFDKYFEVSVEFIGYSFPLQLLFISYYCYKQQIPTPSFWWNCIYIAAAFFSIIFALGSLADYFLGEKNGKYWDEVYIARYFLERIETEQATSKSIRLEFNEENSYTTDELRYHLRVLDDGGYIRGKFFYSLGNNQYRHSVMHITIKDMIY